MLKQAPVPQVLFPEPCSEPSSPSISPQPVTVFQVGDLVDLVGPSAAPEFRNQSAVVTKVFESHCAVIVLDDSMHGIGECWPNLIDITLHGDVCWRLNQRVVISGLHHKHRQGLNGRVGEITEHPHEGHPVFISRHGSKHPQLALCVRLDELWEGKKTVVLEPRFVHSWDDELLKATRDLAAVAAVLKTAANEAEPQAEPSPRDLACLLHEKPKPLNKCACFQGVFQYLRKGRQGR